MARNDPISIFPTHFRSIELAFRSEASHDRLIEVVSIKVNLDFKILLQRETNDQPN